VENGRDGRVNDGFKGNQGPDSGRYYRVTNRWNASPVSSFTYINDALGRRTNRLDDGSVQNAFSYNGRSELTGAEMGTNDYTYVYDNIGNRITYTNNSAGIDYTANALNQYTQLVAGASQTNLLYDLDGNLTNDGVRVYSWNGENRLIGVEPLAPASGDKKVAIAYDYMGRRVEKVVSTYSGGWSVSQTNTYLYNGWNLVQETIQNQQSKITNHFVWGLDISGTLQGAGGIGGLLAWSRSDDQKTFLYCFDANGNVTEILDADDGSLAADYTYNPYGRVPHSDYEEDENNPFRFSSKYSDDETDLAYYGYRYYSPETGRWPSRDPIGERGGVNPYAFVLNSPVMGVDLVGLKCRLCKSDAVMTYFATVGLAESDITYSGGVLGTSLSTPPQPGNREALIVFQLLASPRVFTIKNDSVAELKKHVNARKLVAEKAGAHPFVYDGFRAPPGSPWRNQLEWTGDISDALKHMWSNEYRSGCFGTAMYAFAYGVILADPSAKASLNADRMLTVRALQSSGVLKMMPAADADKETDWVIGDWGRFDNDVPSGTVPADQHYESVIHVTGHGEFGRRFAGSAGELPGPRVLPLKHQTAPDDRNLSWWGRIRTWGRPGNPKASTIRRVPAVGLE